MKEKEKYYDVIDDFINHPNSKILLLKGKWGIGKTFFWKNYLKDKISTSSFRAYSYVSLFGLDNINTIKEEIFGNAEILDTELKSLKKLGSMKILSSIAKQVPYIKEYKGIISQFENAFIKNFLICFDDIERKSKEISLTTFLGLCNQLKEESDCKIIIIMNQDEINKSKEESEELLIYREKVIDQELLFQPSLKDNYSIIFNDVKYEYVFDLVEKYNIVNLRILQKIKWNLDFFEKYFHELEPSIKTYFNRQIIALSFFILSSDLSSEFNIISVDVDDNYNFNEDLVGRKTSFFSSYGYFFESRDKIFIDYIRDLHFDQDGLKDYLFEVNEKEKKTKIKSKIEHIWSKYSANFLLSPNEFLLNFTDLLDADLQYLSLKELDSILNAIKKLEPNYGIDKYWEKYIEINIDQSNLDKLASLKSRVSDSTLIDKIEKKYSEKITSQSIKETIYHIVQNNSWNHNHILRLLQAEEKEYYDWILSETDSDILYNLRSFTRTFNPSSNNNEYRNIGIKIYNVLNEIAKIDKLKELRVREFFEIKENV